MADDLMYAAKKSGKNTVKFEMFGPPYEIKTGRYPEKI
jgi:hypothetical protein